MKDTTSTRWPRGLRWLGGLLARLRGRAYVNATVALRDDADWLARSAVGEEDPGASVEALVDPRPPTNPSIKGDAAPPH
ncbi:MULTISPECIES: hypothetical protein [Hydrogenophaga]|uniref:Uncharacterized protein n=1 Tax=Hydrogenophaga intermedia TaxID=65786 RepID=A0A1L1P9V9_HYDIT|nr:MULTISPECIES: hypothetical protein [Hydrogenophaga]TMU77023.1 hypothetical protein FGJ01_03925 [Hydrogenophaga intermedia]CDN86648.1 hypothetical protein BN948_01054 [Hydrogenophaga intermedia]